MNIYAVPCPKCSAPIVSTERIKDDVKAITACAEGHTFTRAQAIGVYAQKYALAEYYKAMKPLTGPRSKMNIQAAARLTATADPIQQALIQALAIRKSEIRAGQGFSAGRMTATLMHKYGHSQEATAGAIARLASVGLAAAARLQAAIEHKLMARTTPITRVADKGIKEIMHQMLLRGFRAKTVESRGNYTTTFIRDTEDGGVQVFELFGWNGNGRYGLEKTAFEFYDESRGHKPVVNFGPITEENVNVARQEKVIHEMIDYIKKHCD